VIRRPLSDQLARDRLRHKIGRADVKRKYEVEIFDPHIGKGRGLVCAGVVYEDVERRLGGDRCFHCIHVAHIKREWLGLLSARANGLSCFLDLLGGARGKRDLGAGIGQCRSCRQPDAAAGTGHQRALAVEAERRRPGQIDGHSAACAYGTLRPP
jgi:hypothetical protein